MANRGESQQQRVQRLPESWQRNQAWSGRRELNPRSQLGKQTFSLVFTTNSTDHVVIFWGVFSPPAILTLPWH